MLFRRAEVSLSFHEIQLAFQTSHNQIHLHDPDEGEFATASRHANDVSHQSGLGEVVYLTLKLLE